MEDFQPHIALDVEDFQSHLALDELEVVEELVELVGELEELDVALAVGSSSLVFLLKGLPLDCSVRDCGLRWLGLILEGTLRLKSLRFPLLLLKTLSLGVLFLLV